MFDYAVGVLHMSEPEAWLRINVARFGRQYPQAIQMLARGELHMTAIRILASVLTPETVGLLEEARFKSKQQVLELRAKHFPKPDVPSLTRNVPARGATKNVASMMMRSSATTVPLAPPQPLAGATQQPEVVGVR